MAEVSRHWRASCCLNATLCGSRHQPVCARVYSWDDGWVRSVYLKAMDLAFGEHDHCGRVYRKWIMDGLPDVEGRRGPDAGY